MINRTNLVYSVRYAVVLKRRRRLKIYLLFGMKSVWIVIIDSRAARHDQNEPLLMIFKFALKSDSEHIIEAVRIIIAVALLPGLLGIYTYLGGRRKGCR